MMAISDSFSGNDILERHFADDLQWNKAASRHQADATTLFCDGHVAFLSVRSTYRDTTDDALASWNRDYQPHREQLP
jgi:prepilin-type processing-associated H-X9-DG protein